MFDQSKLDASKLIEIAASRGLTRKIEDADLSADPANWSDGVLVALLIQHTKNPTAGHLYRGFEGHGRGSRFACGGKLWQVADIGRRTLTAMHVSEAAQKDPSLLIGVAEYVFDRDDFPAIEFEPKETSPAITPAGTP